MHWCNLIPGSLCATLRVKVKRSEKPITTDYSEIAGMPAIEREREIHMDGLSEERQEENKMGDKAGQTFFVVFSFVL